METETALLWGFVVLLLLVLATIFSLLVHSGIFVPVEVKTCKPDIGTVYIAYKFARGPYKESGALFTQIHTLLPEYRTIGVYYDDPKMKQPQKLRYIVGVILAENDSPLNVEHRKLLQENGYQFTSFPAIDHAVQTIFPFKSTISIVVAIMKVYPALREYVEARSLCARPFLEVYDNKKAEIVFIGPLAQQDDFYVPEVLMDEDNDHEHEYDDDNRTENSSRSWNESTSFVRGDSECSDSGGDESISHPPPPPSSPPPPPPPPPATTTPSKLSATPNLTTTSDTPLQQPPPPSSPISLFEECVAENPTPTTAPDPVDLMPPPPTPPAAPAPATPAPATPPSVPATPPPPAPTTPPPAPIPAEPVEAGDTVDSGSQGGEESDANTGSSFEEIDEKEAVAAMPSDGEKVGEGSVKKDEDEGER